LYPFSYDFTLLGGFFNTGGQLLTATPWPFSMQTYLDFGLIFSLKLPLNVSDVKVGDFFLKEDQHAQKYCDEITDAF